MSEDSITRQQRETKERLDAEVRAITGIPDGLGITKVQVEQTMTGERLVVEVIHTSIGGVRSRLLAAINGEDTTP